MGDKIDSFFEMFGNNKRSLVYAIIAYVLVLIVVLVIIWWPKGNNFATYEDINIDVKKQELSQSYFNKLSNMFKKGKTDDFKELISDSYATYVGKSKNEIVNELVRDGFFKESADIVGISVYTDSNTYVYSTTVYSKSGNSRKINIVETFPYRYNIVFDDFYMYNTDINKSSIIQNIRFTINSVYKNLRFIEFDMKIQNLNKSYIRLNNSTAVAVQAVLEDGNTYNLSNLVSSELYTTLESNSTLNKKYVFEVPAQYQNNIKYIRFNAVNINFAETNINVEV